MTSRDERTELEDVSTETARDEVASSATGDSEASTDAAGTSARPDDVSEPPPKTPPESSAATVPEPEPASAPAESNPADAAPAPETGDAAPAEGEEAKPKPRRKRKPKDPAIARAFRARRAVRGKVVAVVKGGYEVRVGETRAFCPHSQIDVVRVDDAESKVGDDLDFAIIQYRRGGDDIVLSRRRLVEAEREEEAKAVRAALVVDHVVQGRVVGLADFGAFVDLGAGVQGLVHVSELGVRRISKVEEAVAVGDTIDVKILKIEQDGRRISLSARRAQPDPWVGVERRYATGGRHEGKVVRHADFGAFVELEPGLEALAPAREFPPFASDWRQELPVGETRAWSVLAVDPRRRRLTVSPEVEGLELDDSPLQAGQERRGRVQRVERFGVFVWLRPGCVGLIPTSLAGVPQGTRLDSKFTPGRDVDVTVVEAGAQDGKIRLAVQGVDKETIEADLERARERRSEGKDRRAGTAKKDTMVGPEDAGAFGNNLGDLLRAAFDRKDG